MPTRSSAVELLAALARALGRRRWYLFGAQAVNVYGRPRMTADVDVTVEIERARLPAFVAQLEREGFQLRVANAREFVKATSVLPFVHSSTGMPLDLVVAGSALERMFLDRAQPIDIGGVVVPVISPGDLVVAKILAGRPKDLDDAAGVLRERGRSIDVKAVRALLCEIEEALAQSDLIPALERAVTAAGDKRQRAPSPPKRTAKLARKGQRTRKR